MNGASAAGEDALFNALAAGVESAHGQETAALALRLQLDEGSGRVLKQEKPCENFSDSRNAGGVANASTGSVLAWRAIGRGYA